MYDCNIGIRISSRENADISIAMCPQRASIVALWVVNIPPKFETVSEHFNGGLSHEDLTNE